MRLGLLEKRGLHVYSIKVVIVAPDSKCLRSGGQTECQLGKIDVAKTKCWITNKKTKNSSIHGIDLDSC